MFGKNDSKELTESIYQDLISRLLKEKEENEALRAKNQTLEMEVASLKSDVKELRLHVSSLESAQDRILDASLRMGIDLSGVRDVQDNFVWISRTIPYLAAFVRPAVEAVNLPHFDEAKHVEALRSFMEELPGFGREECHPETEKHYEFMRMGATQFLPHTRFK